jgi:hypothetical protein
MKDDTQAPRSYTAEEITDWTRRYRASGLGLAAFAEQHGLPRARLHYWVYRRRSSRPRPRVAPAPVFQELKFPAGLAAQNWAVEISWPTGAVARFSAAAKPASMKAVMSALRRPC